MEFADIQSVFGFNTPQAKQEKEESGNDNIISCDIVNHTCKFWCCYVLLMYERMCTWRLSECI